VIVGVFGAVASIFVVASGPAGADSRLPTPSWARV
jgi:hypothetical protein